MPYKDKIKKLEYSKKWREEHLTYFKEYNQGHKLEKRLYDIKYRQIDEVYPKYPKETKLLKKLYEQIL